MAHNNATSAPSTQPAAPSTQPAALTLTDEGLRIWRTGLLIDGHNDLPWRFHELAGGDVAQLDLRVHQPKLQTDIPRLREGGLDAQFWVVYVPPETLHTHTAAAMAIEQLNLIHRMVERYPDVFEMATTADDIERIHRSGKIASLIGIEGGHTLENSLENLARFYELGARYLGLTYSETLDWADSATDTPRSGGLSPFGEQVVLEMNRVGMLVDLAHVSADTMRDALRVSRAPVIVSHSSTYAVAQHVRNVPDDVLRMIRDNGGVVMVNFFSGYSHPEGARAMSGYFETERELHQQYPDEAEFKKAWRAYRDLHPIPAGDAYTLVDHIDHIVQVAGVDHAGFGSDYEGASRMPLQLEDVSGYPYLIQALVNRGYSEGDIHKIMGGNLLRVLRAAEQVARDLRTVPPAAEPR